MSSPATSPCSSPHVSQLPQQFFIMFDRNELIVALRWCERFSPADTRDCIAVVTLEEEQRRWAFVEKNVMGFYVNPEPSPFTGVIPVTQTLLSIAIESIADDDITIEFNVLCGVYRIQVDDALIEIPMPHEWDIDARFSLEEPTRLTVNTSDLVAMGRTFFYPTTHASVDDEPIPDPFIICDVANGVLSAKRSWAHSSDEKMAVSLPVQGDYSGTFGFAPEVVIREMFYVDTYCEGTTSVEISTKGNPIVCVRGPRCGFSFIVCEEFVCEMRNLIIEKLADVGCDLEVIAGNEWDSHITVLYQSHEVDVLVIPVSNAIAGYIRVSRLVTDEISWNLALAEEINSWNASLVNTKLVRSDTQLMVVADVHIDDLSTLSDVIDDVVNQSRKVNDFIAIFQ